MSRDIGISDLVELTSEDGLSSARFYINGITNNTIHILDLADMKTASALVKGSQGLTSYPWFLLDSAKNSAINMLSIESMRTKYIAVDENQVEYCL